jgi:general secretion pathway protein G
VTRRLLPASSRRGCSDEQGMTVIELLVGIAVLSILAALLMPYLVERLAEVKVHRAIAELRLIGDEIAVYKSELGEWPRVLDDLPRPAAPDPWGNPYRYLSSSDRDWRAKSRRDRFLVPINSDFDLYSSGPDGLSTAPLTAQHSRDDIVRADDGAFYGRASDF